MCFDVKIRFGDRYDNNSNVVAKRPSKPEIRDDEWQLIQRCCAKEPKSRPTMDEVVLEMEAWRGYNLPHLQNIPRVVRWLCTWFEKTMHGDAWFSLTMLYHVVSIIKIAHFSDLRITN
jgi:hypothetical protein